MERTGSGGSAIVAAGGAVVAMRPTPCTVWGLPLLPLSLGGATDAVGAMVEAGRPAYFITANLNYAMLTHAEGDLPEINRQAAFVLADGMPLVWAARWKGLPLSERVAGSELIFEISELAAERGYRLFLLGGAPGVAAEAATNLRARYPGIQIVGTESPPFGRRAPAEEAALIDRIRATRPDILFVAFGQPKGERWIAEHLEALGIPACVQVGASLDFAAGRMRRAPRPLQRAGLEWAYRLALEPRRLGCRYLKNALFLLRMAALDLHSAVAARLPSRAARSEVYLEVDPAGVDGCS